MGVKRTGRLGRLVAGTFGVDAAVEDIGPALKALGCYERRDGFIRELVPEYGDGWASKIVIAAYESKVWQDFSPKKVLK